MSRQPPVQQAPPAQRLRLRYAKRGPARFTSHRDFGRAFERALRRAGVPMAYSSGFSPHPRISYANASPTGAATEAEYLELGLAEVCDPAKLMAALNAALPPGMVVLAVGPGGGPSLADLLQASRWRIVLPDAEPEALRSAAESLLGRSSVQVERMTKSGMRSFDARAAIISLSAEGTSLDLVSKQETPLVRPDDVVNALRQVEPRLSGLGPALLTRLEQGPLTSGGIGDPLASQPTNPPTA
ncbi:MAG: TIGR03936 family radical SAM-associated protein [Propionibacteriaceae bacterium]|nr:TIGR03936 family radical SAM-associated protein [Propionibacteriaceae bacterium]